jgi:DNA end-binding protein Ku
MAKAGKAKEKVVESKEAQIAAASAALAQAVQPERAAAIVEPPILEKPFATKATWVGTLTFGLVTMPIKTYTATKEDTLSFNMLHSVKCPNRLKQGDMKCSCCDAVVAKADSVKGYEHRPGEFVIVNKEELEACAPLGDKIVEITEFVNASDVDPIYFQSTDFVAPDKAGEKPFAILRAGMVKLNKVALGKVVMRGRELTVVIRPYGTNGLAMSYMFFENEVRAFEGWDKVPSVVNDRETAIAVQLIEAMSDDFKPETKFDSYAVNVKNLLKAKIAGEVEPVVEKKAQMPKTTDLMAALEASLTAAAKSKKKSA